MKPMLLFSADPPEQPVRVALAAGRRAAVIVTSKPAHDRLLAVFEAPHRSRELLLLDADLFARLAMDKAPGEPDLARREGLIEAAIAYIGVPDLLIVLDPFDMARFIPALRRQRLRPRGIAVAGGNASQIEELFQFGYRDVVFRHGAGGARALLATEEDLSQAVEPALLELRRLAFALMAVTTTGEG